MPRSTGFTPISVSVSPPPADSGPNDMLIAAHALALEATLVTAKVGEFSRVSGSLLENWLQ